MKTQTHKKICIVTGGSFGIGYAVCQKFLEHNYHVVNLDIKGNPKQSTDIEWIECDMSNAVDITSNFQSIISQHKRVDALISNAGIHYSGNIEQTADEDFERVFSLNVKGAIAATKAVLPIMKQQLSGVILYMASDQAIVAKPNSFAYNLSKTALASMAKTTALDYAKFNIRANAICPGTIETPLYHTAIQTYVDKSGADIKNVHKEEASLQPLGRLGKAHEVAALTYFLATNDAAFITGSLQSIDGGYTAQ
ncbi:MAG: SDR family oxidoreductase [Paraglaciecola sp.]|uniref:SDR family NAD(P)-dependent oxidoreductase n=1 Tax=Paraglaciecola sp. TaxID=1920173 RepID=UPI00326519B1